MIVRNGCRSESAREWAASAERGGHQHGYSQGQAAPLSAQERCCCIRAGARQTIQLCSRRNALSEGQAGDTQGYI